MSRLDIDIARCVKAVAKYKGNKTRAAASLDVSRATLKRRLDQAEYVSTDIPLEQEHKLQRKAKDLNLKLKAAASRLEDQFEMQSLVASLSGKTKALPKWTQPKRVGSGKTIATAVLSDAHYDEVVDPKQINWVNSYSRDIATKRTKVFFDNIIRLGRDYCGGVDIEGLVLPIIGDMLTGNIHEELRETNEDTVINTCLYYSDLLSAGILQALEFYSKIHVPTVVGNHGRLDKKPRAKNGPTDNLDYLIYNLISRKLERYPEVTFDISQDFDCRYKIYSTRYNLTHGDQFKGGSGIAGMLSPLMLGDARKRKRETSTNSRYDYLVMGHWHQYANFKGIIVNGSLKGYDEYAARMNFELEPPQQAFWLTDPTWGKTIMAPVQCTSAESESWRDDRPEAKGVFA